MGCDLRSWGAPHPLLRIATLVGRGPGPEVQRQHLALGHGVGCTLPPRWFPLLMFLRVSRFQVSSHLRSLAATPQRPDAFDICNALWFYNLTNPGSGNLLNRFACRFQIVLFFPLLVYVSMNVPEPTRSLSLPFGKQKFGHPPF